MKLPGGAQNGRIYRRGGEKRRRSMAEINRILSGDFDEILDRIESGIMSGSVSATCEGSNDWDEDGARCSVRVFERFSFIGGNRLSMTVVLFQARGGPVRLTAVTAGGSQALFFKINTFGEEAFMGALEELL